MAGRNVQAVKTLNPMLWGVSLALYSLFPIAHNNPGEILNKSKTYLFNASSFLICKIGMLIFAPFGVILALLRDGI